MTDTPSENPKSSENENPIPLVFYGSEEPEDLRSAIRTDTGHCVMASCLEIRAIAQFWIDARISTEWHCFDKGEDPETFQEGLEHVHERLECFAQVVSRESINAQTSDSYKRLRNEIGKARYQPFVNETASRQKGEVSEGWTPPPHVFEEFLDIQPSEAQPSDESASEDDAETEKARRFERRVREAAQSRSMRQAQPWKCDHPFLMTSHQKMLPDDQCPICGAETRDD